MALLAAAKPLLAANSGSVWAQVESTIRTRTADQCRLRYRELEDNQADLKTGPFSPAEEQHILQLLKQHGRQFKVIGEALQPQRAGSDVQKHCRSGAFAPQANLACPPVERGGYKKQGARQVRHSSHAIRS